MAAENKTQIIIKKGYFDNIKTAITSIDTFFASNFSKKDFPIVDGDFQLDSVLMNILSWFNNIEPSWCLDDELLNQSINEIIEACEAIDKPNDNQSMYEYLIEINNSAVLDKLNAYIGFEMLHDISENFDAFTQLVNGIYTFELYTKPSAYKNCIDIFSKQVYLTDGIQPIIGDTHISIFDTEKYVAGVFANKDQITLPDTLKQDIETTRMQNCNDLQDVEVIVDDRVEEAAVPSEFEKYKPADIRYDAKKDEFLISVKYKTSVDKMISELRKCNSSDDLITLFSDEKGIMASMIEWCAADVSPFILNKVFNSEKKFPVHVREEAHKGIDSYMKAYNKKADSNPGAKRFINYDLFTTFKVDKEGTLKFLRDFLTIDLYNYKKATITNNTLLTLFNIFDSRIYLSSLYHLISDKDKKDKGFTTEDSFVKDTRARINANSRAVNIYNKSASDNLEDAKTSSEIMEYVSESYKELGDMSTTDMQYCEQYHALLNMELSCMGDLVHNETLSPIKIDRFMEGSYEVIQEGFIRDFFRNRKMKHINEIQQQSGVKFSQEYIDILIGKLNIKSFAINTSWSIYRLFTRLKSSVEKADFNNALVDIRANASISNALKDELYPIGILKYSYTLPKIDYPVIASDAQGNVYVTQQGGFFQVASNIREFVRVIVDKPVQMKISDYQYQPTCTNNVVSVKFPTSAIDAMNLRMETVFMEDEGSGWYRYVTKIFYPALSEYCRDNLGFGDNYAPTIGMDGSSGVAYVPFNAAKVFKIVERTYVNDPDSRKSHVRISIGFRKMESNNPIGTVTCVDGAPVKFDLDNVTSSPQAIMGLKPHLFDQDMNNATKEEQDSTLDVKDIQPTEPQFANIPDPVQESYIQEGILSTLFGKKDDTRTFSTHDFDTLESKYGVKFPQDFVDGINSDKYQELTRMVNYQNPAKLTVGSTTHNIVHFANIEAIYDWNSEFAEPGIDHVRFAGLDVPEDDIAVGVDVNNGTYHFVYAMNDASEPFAKSFSEFMSKLEIPDSTQESYIQEAKADVDGEIPEYMKTRIDMSNDENDKKPPVGQDGLNIPPDTPENDIDDLCGSINARLNRDGDLSDMLGSGANVQPNKGGVVYNITNNYSNSFNTNSNNTTTNDDHSTGKVTHTTYTNSNNDSSKNKKTTVDSSTMKNDRKPEPIRNQGTNNYNNSNDFADTKDSDVNPDNEQTFATGHTVREMFAFLESEEPLSVQEAAGKPPKGDVLTTAMDKDRESMAGRQTIKKGAQKVYNTGRAILKPITRTKQQLAKVVNSLIKRDEDKVKAEIIENPSYRSTLFKAARLALKVGAFGILTTINGYLGAAYAVKQVKSLSDRQRLQKEVQSEFKIEIDILNKRIEKAELDHDMDQMAKLMRIRNKMQDMIGDSTKQKVKSRYSIY